MINLRCARLYLKMSQNQANIGSKMVIVALLNSMIGGTILVLPLIGVKTGYVMIIIVCSALGYISYYTCQLILTHLGKAKTMKQSILNHFGSSAYVVAYGIFIWINVIPFLMVNFNLICIQLNGLIGSYQWIQYLVAGALLVYCMIIMHYQFGQQTMGLGIISIILYLIFIMWALCTSPSGQISIQPIGSTYELVSTLLMAYSIHDILLVVIIRHQNKANYPNIIVITFILGTVAYTYITYGSYSIVNRIPQSPNPQTINDYFEPGSIPISIIELIYLLHLFTVFPEYLILTKIRFYQVFEIQNNHFSIKDAVYVFFIILICFIFQASGIKLQTLITINGSICGYFLIIFIPIWIHLKCTFYDKSSGYVAFQQQRNGLIKSNPCQCNNTYSSKALMFIQVCFLVFVLLFGFGFMISSVRDILSPQNS